MEEHINDGRNVNWEENGRLHVVLDGQVLAAHHHVSLEPFAAELLGGAIGCVGPFDGDAIVDGALGGEVDLLAGDSHQDGLVGIEHSIRRIHSQARRIRRLDGPADATSSRVVDLNTDKLTV